MTLQESMNCAYPPFRPQELNGLFGPVLGGAARQVALAVSGGGDSTALMVLFAEWLAGIGQSPAEAVVLTVDHGLRPQSRLEALTVGRWAGELGFRHAILPWAGTKPKTGVQAAARAARYRLLATYMLEAGLKLLLTAHTADDQAETLLMRLARGSGLDGLAAMAPLVPLEVALGPGQGPILLGRPLLGLSKVRLETALIARGRGWLEDASNTASRFERSRLRAAAETLASLGLTGDSLGVSARRLQRARGALEAMVAGFCAAAAGHYRVDACGSIRIDGPEWRQLPSELQLRVLRRAIAAAGGAGRPLPLAKLETLAAALAAAGASGAWTLARAAVRAVDGDIVLEREPGRRPWPELALVPGTRALWDGRFWVGAGPELDAAVIVRALGRPGVGCLRALGQLPGGISIQSLRAVPGFWRHDQLIAAPSLGFLADPDYNRYGLSAVFAPLAIVAAPGAEAATQPAMAALSPQPG
jgi:tRNA(Ile)-lysidine synthase